jgi:hypothetical protein
MSTTTTQITNCHRNMMGTVSFDAKFPGMRKAQDFIVYPMHDSGTTIRIQSDNRFGQMDLETGACVLSANSGSAHASGVWLQLCVIRRTALRFTLAEEDRQTLRQWVKSTGGVRVGESFVKTDNTGALAL